MTNAAGKGGIMIYVFNNFVYVSFLTLSHFRTKLCKLKEKWACQSL